MHKVFIPLSCILLFISTSLPAQEKHPMNSAGIGTTLIFPMTHGIYFDTPWDFWPNQEKSYFTRLFYDRSMNTHLKVGAYIETGSCIFTDQTGIDKHSFRRNVVGLQWNARYPDRKLHMELGGYIGYGQIKANNWDKLKGADFGMLAGPAFESKHFGVSCKIKAGFSPFNGTGTPEGVLMLSPGLLVEVYGRF